MDIAGLAFIVAAPILAGLVISLLWVTPILLWKRPNLKSDRRAQAWLLAPTAPWLVLHLATAAVVTFAWRGAGNPLAPLIWTASLAVAMILLTAGVALVSVLRLRGLRWVAVTFALSNLFIASLCALAGIGSLVVRVTGGV